MAEPTDSDRYDYYAKMDPGGAGISTSQREAFFHTTEPDLDALGPEFQTRTGLPSHGRALPTKKLTFIMSMFLARVAFDVSLGAAKAWKVGTPLPSPDAPIQPLGDGRTNVVY